MASNISYGFWISPSGKIYHVNDHYGFLIINYKKFKVNKNTIKNFDLSGPVRDKLLRFACEMGWTRVRGDSGCNFSFEVWRLTPNNLSGIKTFLRKLKVPDNKEVIVEQASTGKSIFEPAKKFYNDDLLYEVNPFRRRKK